MLPSDHLPSMPCYYNIDFLDQHLVPNLSPQSIPKMNYRSNNTLELILFHKNLIQDESKEKHLYNLIKIKMLFNFDISLTLKENLNITMFFVVWLQRKISKTIFKYYICQNESSNLYSNRKVSRCNDVSAKKTNTH